MRQPNILQSKPSVIPSFKKAGTKSDKPKKIPPDCRVTVRFSLEEQAQLKIAASGMTISAYIRECLFGHHTSKRVVPAADRVLLGQILAQLGASRMANNLNQLAYHANCGALVIDEATEEDINEACAHVAWMRVKLIEALGLKDRNKS